MSSSDDDMPIRHKSKAQGRSTNGVHPSDHIITSSNCLQITISRAKGLTIRSMAVMFIKLSLSLHVMLNIVSDADFSAQGVNHKSGDVIPKSLDRAMDKANPSNHHVEPGISLRNGPIDEMDVDAPVHNGHASNEHTNGHINGKRKSRPSMSNGKSYKDASNESDEDDKPLVRLG